MQSAANTPTARYTYSLPPDDSQEIIMDMDESVRAVEKLLRYRFNDKKLLEEALTHPSYTGSASYQRLEFVGDAALGLAVSNYAYLAYPNANPGKLSLVRSANISTEKLARVAVRHQLYNYVRHSTTVLGERVKEFVIAVEQEHEMEVYGGLVKAPKVLADIVESLAAAVYVDCNFDLKTMWMIFRDLLEPIVMLDVVEQQPQPVTLLYELCRKDGKHVDILHWRDRQRDINVASVYVNGSFVASASSEQKDNAKLHAAKIALQKLSYEAGDMMKINIFGKLNADNEIEGAKHKLYELCGKRSWSKPNYKVQKEAGRSHEKKYICSVEIHIAQDILFVTGKEKSRVKEAENSAASAMLFGLRNSNYL